ncbi:single-strand selective monofunctional uracil DNA glycosylase [Sitophilus oryzae]|uniref:Single-strand selective monofunctional uracil DNA glycosylase n=1 Tax=Sitophilus oryzae TaxID=7048 RepID=A0A6J2Y8E9_SITOR|nr:single-strand selective monofunctional uracil DNA glycosylase [Sitophilus oryzae]
MLRSKLQKSALYEDSIQNSELLDLSLQNCPSSEISKYFPNKNTTSNGFLDNIFTIQRNLNAELNQIDFKKHPIKFVYNPTVYASEPCEKYFKRYCHNSIKLLLVGMNPGPFGMCQTGVPFGDTNWVKNWLCIEGHVSKPPVECPARPVQGFNCTRKEQSGDRFWKFWSELCGTPDKFFSNAFVYNYCPLAFMDEGGKNLTPADIKDRKVLESVCDKYYLELIRLVQPELVIAIGSYIEKRTKALFKASKMTLPVICLPHPSPRAVNNNNWPEKARNFLEKHQLMHFFQ